MYLLGTVYVGYSEFDDDLRSILFHHDLPLFYEEGYDYLEVFPLMQLAGAHITTIRADQGDYILKIEVEDTEKESFYRRFLQLIEKYYDRRALGPHRL